MRLTDLLVIIAVLLLAGSVWQSYRVALLKRRVALAEKCTEIQTVLLEVLLEAKGLYRIMRSTIADPSQEVSFPDEIKQLSQELGQIIQAVASRIEWLQTQNIEDPVVLDEYKFYANQVRLKLMKISPVIKSLKAIPEEKKD